MKPDKIKIEDLEVYANHGVLPEENVLGQKFVEEENYEYAIPCLENLLEAGRGDDNTRLALSNAYAMMEEYKKSIEILENLENKGQ